jgi:hypothetical protein
MFENKVLRKTCEPNKDELSEQFKIYYIKWNSVIYKGLG